MLWKIFGNSQTTALHYILNVQNEATGFNRRVVPTSITIRYAAKIRQRFYETPRSETHLANQLAGILKKNLGAYYWNDGTVCMKLPKEQHPGEGWIRGMLPRDTTEQAKGTANYQRGTIYWNNGVHEIKFKSYQPPPESETPWIRGRLKRK